MIQLLRNNTHEDNLQKIADEVLQRGCESGIIAELVADDDAAGFYRRNRNAIGMVVSNHLGSNPAIFFGDQWDRDDPTASNPHNQKLLVWFAVEQTIRDKYFSIVWS
ncbi:DUF7222 domain-containing protein [Sulfobacillus thermosulfidooxidans]|uniref:DUF7222 domain-containing protein n=1 Tax=Sulfobacillus thermosulfidooxidans TaxID=28034 RepID=UPI0006B5ABDC|nr:hypothetical protein [Sulfobacillus thermosulfidooxidans]